MPKYFNHHVAYLKYAIREIVDTAQHIKELDPSYNFVWENIGDPVAKGWNVPPFLKQILIEEINKPNDEAFAYSHSRGNPQTRQWVAQYAKRFSPNSTLDYEHVLFTNGLGSAIAIVYQMLKPGARVIQPTPSYPTHVSLESFAAEAKPIFYNLDPNKNWEPDLTDLEQKIKASPEVAGILVINPNNPTGAVYSKETLQKIVTLAKKHHLFIIADEVYFRMVYNGYQHQQITELVQNQVPLIIMRGLSKDIPWPGGRCGWIEFHNTNLDDEFKKYSQSIKQRILLEVCSTSLPQRILPKLYNHPEFENWNKEYNKGLEEVANLITNILSKSKYLNVVKPNGAFYLMPLFKEGLLNHNQTLPIKNSTVKKYIEHEVSQPNFALDKRFTYYLLASEGIVVAPASGFYSHHHGFRVTTLDKNKERCKNTYTRLVKAAEAYVKSA